MCSLDAHCSIIFWVALHAWWLSGAGRAAEIHHSTAVKGQEPYHWDFARGWMSAALKECCRGSFCGQAREMGQERECVWSYELFDWCHSKPNASLSTLIATL